MNSKKPKLERYLTRVDAALGSIAVSERADIITELKSHILSELDRNPNQSMDSILRALGEAEHVANRYLLERGLKPTKAPRHPALKWITVGLLGSLSLMVVFAIFAITKLTPIIEVNEKLGRVRILGGLIDINEDPSKEGLGKFEDPIETSGTAALSKQNMPIKIPFNNAVMTVENSKDENLRWNCKLDSRSQVKNLELIEEKGRYKLDMSNADGARCQISLPKNTRLVADGSNGAIELKRPEFDVDLKVQNGKVSISPRKDTEYSYDLDVMNGKIDSGFISSKESSAKAIKVSIMNGTINNIED